MAHKNGIIFITGGGSDLEERPVLSEFLARLSIPKILYIPLALDPESEHYKNSNQWIKNAVAKAENTGTEIKTVLSARDVTSRDYGGIYIGGGNAYRLMFFLKENGLDVIIRESLEEGCSIYGGSAGAIACGKNLHFSNSSKENYTDTHGLNLLNGYSCLCHYSEDDKGRITQYHKDQPSGVIALKETAGAYIDDGKLTSCNDSPVHIYTHHQEKVLGTGEETILS